MDEPAIYTQFNFPVVGKDRAWPLVPGVRTVDLVNKAEEARTYVSDRVRFPVEVSFQLQSLCLIITVTCTPEAGLELAFAVADALKAFLAEGMKGFLIGGYDITLQTTYRLVPPQKT